MPAALPHEERQSLALRRPLPGLLVLRFAGDRPLMQAVPEHYGTTTHLAGRSHWTTRDAAWSSGPGSVSVKVPGEVLVERAREGLLDFQVVVFEAALFDDARAILARRVDRPRTRPLDPRDPRGRPLVALHRRLFGPDDVDALEQATCEALHALLDVVSSSGPADAHRPVSPSAAVVRARALLDERFTETVGLEELAAHARLDKFRLCRAFREQVGLPPHAYVTQRRIALAQDLLGRGLPQAEVAARVGFYDQSLLHRHFKRIVRLTPGAFVRGLARA